MLNNDQSTLNSNSKIPNHLQTHGLKILDSLMINFKKNGENTKFPNYLPK